MIWPKAVLIRVLQPSTPRPITHVWVLFHHIFRCILASIRGCVPPSVGRSILFFVPEGQRPAGTVMVAIAYGVCLCVCPDHGYLWNLHLDFDETWSIVFLGYLKLTQQHLSIFDKYYYPLPMYFFSNIRTEAFEKLHRQGIVKILGCCWKLLGKLLIS